MKKNFLMMMVLSATIATTSFAQVSTTPEVPRNYKPQPKELAPMPGELTTEMIFPVLGKYEYTNKDGEVANVTITLDADSKGIVWVNGLPDGKFKANLKQSPATYKIPTQKTLQNDMDEMADSGDSDSSKEGSSVRYSGKTIKDGTVIFDSTSQKLYVNVGAKYDEENPSAIFPEMTATAMDADASADMEATADTEKKAEKKDKKKAVTSKGTNYVLTKVMDMATEATATETTTPEQQ